MSTKLMQKISPTDRSGQRKRFFKVKFLQKKQKISRKGAKAQRYRKENLCVFLAALRLCVHFCLLAFLLIRDWD
jgi:hypothetical protein